MENGKDIKNGVGVVRGTHDIVKDAAEALTPITEDGITVMQGWYNEDIKDCHVTLWDMGEEEVLYSDDEVEGVMQTVQVTIFSTKDEVALARKIKTLMKRAGFDFEGRSPDDSRPEDGIYMKAQKFTKYYEEMEDMEDE